MGPIFDKENKMIKVEMKLKEPHRAPNRKMPLGPYMVTDEMQMFEISNENAFLLVSDQAKYWMDVVLLDDNVVSPPIQATTKKFTKKISSKKKATTSVVTEG